MDDSRSKDVVSAELSSAFDAMDSNTSRLRQTPALKKFTRPDSLKLELLENIESVRNSIVFPPTNQLRLGFRKLTYTVRDGIFHRREYPKINKGMSGTKARGRSFLL